MRNSFVVGAALLVAGGASEAAASAMSAKNVKQPVSIQVMTTHPPKTFKIAGIRIGWGGWSVIGKPPKGDRPATRDNRKKTRDAVRDYRTKPRPPSRSKVPPPRR